MSWLATLFAQFLLGLETNFRDRARLRQLEIDAAEARLRRELERAERIRQAEQQ